MPPEPLEVAELKEIRNLLKGLIDILEHAVPVPPAGNTNNNTNVINFGSIVAAWICSVCCAIVLTVVLLSRWDQVDQGRKMDRLQDHETIILQYAPQWLRDKITISDERKDK